MTMPINLEINMHGTAMLPSPINQQYHHYPLIPHSDNLSQFITLTYVYTQRCMIHTHLTQKILLYHYLNLGLHQTFYDIHLSRLHISVTTM